jgi:hypothetical protein
LQLAAFIKISSIVFKLNTAKLLKTFHAQMWHGKVHSIAVDKFSYQKVPSKLPSTY